ncbi:hypothetical protein [Azorhizobium doebereinerae]|uniref:hypothetical protein n=1 Tax=Azorhizobium doebereinerae TaxID=281091 RepID=UPI0004149A63|nr:hypothetical protein [Azorhizobium doebereinerae]
MAFGWGRAPAVFLALMLGLPLAAGAEPLAVEVRNDSRPTLCAETDNVALTFSSPAVSSPAVARFRITAVHPAYIGTLAVDRTAADFTACDMSGDPAVPAAPKRVTFYETPDLWLTGYTFPSFWRPAAVPFRVGDKVVEGLHMVQLWVRHAERAEEVMVVYPPDGYWRARPLPPAHLGAAGYGSSFLVGPVETDGRPLVKLKEIAFDPATRTFSLAFAGGGGARLRLAQLDREQLALEVTLDGAITGAPFAALRSMYVTEFNADVTRLAWKAPGRPGWSEAPVMDFAGGKASELWAGRLVPSRHNTSAPDMVFGPFEAGN